MPEGDGNSMSEAGQKEKWSLAEWLAMGALAIVTICFLFAALFDITVPKLLQGIGALLFVAIISPALTLLMWKAAQREKPPFWYFKNVGFWLMAAAFVAAIVIFVLMVLFGMILPPSYLASPFVSDLPWIAMGVLLFMLVAFVVWLAQVGLRARADFRRWLKTGEL